MPFSPSVRKEVLVKSHRRCCVCHDFGGRSVNVHHIIQEADGGPNTIDNAICLCLRCHAEAGHFNIRHPLGTKYSPEELRAHRDQWWDHCSEHPDEPFGLSLYVSFREQGLKSSKEIHRYRLIITYTNTFQEAHQGWKLQIKFPISVELDVSGFNEESVRIGGKPYKRLELESHKTVYPQEELEITSRKQEPYIEYKIDESNYTSKEEVSWSFYTSNNPLINGKCLLNELNEY